jgi:hypothetical protein
MRVWDSILWQRSAPALHDYLCARVGRNLAPDEWERYLPDDPYRETCADFTAA